MTNVLPVTLDDVRDAAARLKGVAHRTPVLRSRTLDGLAGAEVFLKCENLQRVGAFKFRGPTTPSPGSPRSDWPRALPRTPPATTPRPWRWPPVSWVAAR
ncbi:hypothetical protein ACFQ0B_01150 [Nonomuraea thailandensis]